MHNCVYMCLCCAWVRRLTAITTWRSLLPLPRTISCLAASVGCIRQLVVCCVGQGFWWLLFHLCSVIHSGGVDIYNTSTYHSTVLHIILQCVTLTACFLSTQCGLAWAPCLDDTCWTVVVGRVNIPLLQKTWDLPLGHNSLPPGKSMFPVLLCQLPSCQLSPWWSWWHPRHFFRISLTSWTLNPSLLTCHMPVSVLLQGSTSLRNPPFVRKPGHCSPLSFWPWNYSVQGRIQTWNLADAFWKNDKYICLLKVQVPSLVHYSHNSLYPWCHMKTLLYNLMWTDDPVQLKHGMVGTIHFWVVLVLCSIPLKSTAFKFGFGSISLLSEEKRFPTCMEHATNRDKCWIS